MKTPRFVFLGVAAIFLSPLVIQAAKSKAGGSGPALPSTRLRQMIDTTLPRISSLGPSKQQPNRAAISAAHAEWTALAQTAQTAQQATYSAAANVAQALLAAIDEHTKAMADFQYSKKVHGPQERQNLDISNAGERSGTAWANNAKQNKENADSRKELLRKEEFMNKGMIEQWKVRTGQIGTAVEQAYTAELVTEKQMIAARNATPAPATQAPSTTPASAAETYSPVGTWKAPKGTWTLSDDGTFTTAIGTKGTWQWSDRTKRELALKWQKTGESGTAVFSADGKSLQITLPKGGGPTLTR